MSGGADSDVHLVSEVTEEHGPTHLVPLAASAGLRPATGPNSRRRRPGSTNKRSRGRVQRERLSPTAPTPFTGQRSCVHPTPTDSASTPATPMPTTPGPPPLLGDRSFIRIGRPLWNRQPCATSSLRVSSPGHPYWTPETLEGVASRYPGLDVRLWRDPCNPRADGGAIGGKGCRFALVIRGKRRNR